jgi:MSHA pilin protein MshD
MCADRHRRQRGLTMIELIIFILVVTIAVIGVLQVIALNTARSADPIRQKQALAIAEGLMNEIRSAGMALCDISDAVNYGVPGATCAVPDNVGREGTGGRPYDNVNDYVTRWNTPMAYTTDAAPTPNTFPAGYTATVTIPDPATQAAPFPGVPGSAALQVIVTVNYGGDNNVVLSTWRTRYQP